MRRLAKMGVQLLAGASIVVICPALCFAQFGSIAGVVRDGSGAVLPGVTVEAASPALIEETRTAVTDGGGQYRLEQLRPGVYTVTFMLQGFNSVRREGIEISAGFTASVSESLLRVVTPTKETRTVLKGKWDFEWQMGYQYAEPIELSKGSKLQFITHFDNSPANRFNPDAAKKVLWDPQNWDEMSNCFI